MSVSSAYAFFTGQRNAPAGGDALGLNLPLQVVSAPAAPKQPIVLPRFLQDSYVPTGTTTTTPVSPQNANNMLAQAQAIITQLEQRVAALEARAAQPAPSVSTQSIFSPAPVAAPTNPVVIAPVGTPSTPYAPPRLPGQTPSSLPTTPGYSNPNLGLPGQANNAIAQSVNQVTYTVNSVAQSIGVIGQSVQNLVNAFAGIKF